MSRKFLILWILVLLFALSGTLNAKEYANTSFYVAYDSADTTQFALVLPSVNKVYTHQAGHILPSDLKQVDTQFSSFPTYNNGELCFSALEADASGDDGALKMAGNCYAVNFFYTQKETAPNGKMAFILTYIPTDTVYEGLAGDSASFKVVKSGSTILNENSVTNDDYSHFTFDIATTTVTMLGNTAPVANSQNVTTNEDNAKNITLTGSDVDGDALTYSIVSNPNHGLLSGTAPNIIYTPTANYNGSDSFTFKANDGMADSAVATVSIMVNKDPNVIYITEDYEVHQLGKGSTVNKRVQVDTTAKSLYILLSNYSPTASDSVIITHNAKVSAVKKSARVASNTKLSKKYTILPTPTHIQNFQYTLKDRLISNSSKKTAQFKSFSLEPLRKDVAGNTQTFYLDTSDSGPSTQATARKIVSDISTAQGTKTLNIWVSDDSFDSGSGCSKARCVTQTMVDAFAETFLKAGADNDIYDWVSNIFGEEWSSDASAKYSNVIAANNEITILLTDIDGDNSTNGGTVGYFYAKDNYAQSSLSGSNERIMFYIDSVLFAKEDEDEAWSMDAYWPKEMISTIAHEFQHMIHFYQKYIINEVDTIVWLDEMLSETIEDVVATKLHLNGPRGIDYTDGSAGSPGNTEGRYPLFNENNTLSLTNWQNNLRDYSKVNAFGAFLTRNYGGAKILHDIVHNSLNDVEAVVDAVGKTAQGSGKTFDDILREWGIAVLLSDNDNLQNQPAYNTGDFTQDTYGNSTYELGSINFFNYDPLPTIYSVGGTVRPQSNYFYKIGDNITGSVDINITLSDTTEATLIVK